MLVKELICAKRYEVELIVNDGAKTYRHEFNNETLARQKFAAILRTLDSGDELSMHDIWEGDTLLAYKA